MKKALNLLIIFLFVLLSYFLILSTIGLFVYWIEDKSWWLTVLLTFLLMIILRPLFFHFPKIITRVLKYRYPTLIITKIIDLLVTAFYLIFYVKLLVADGLSSIKGVAVFLVLLFVFARSFKSGVMEYVLKYIYYPREKDFEDMDTWRYKIFFEHYF